MVLGVTPTDELVEIEFGPLALLYFLQLIFFILRIFWLVISGLRHSSGSHKARLRWIGIGVFVAFGTIIITNITLPFFFGAFYPSVLAPLVFGLLVGVFAYVIVKHRLFSIRAEIVRALAYLLSIATIVGLMTLIIVFIGTQFIDLGESGFLAEEAVLVTLIIISLAIYRPLRMTIEKVTDGIFYRDKYDSREVIDRVSDIFIAELLDEKTLIHRSMHEINKAIKASFIVYIDAGHSEVLIGPHNESEKSSFSKKYNYPSEVYLRNEVDYSDIDENLERKNVDMVFVLSKSDDESRYFAIGPKHNGSSYSRQDYELIKTLRKNLAIAVQNAHNYQEISRFTDVLRAEVEKATTKLRNTNKDLRQTSTAKDEFISMAAHQIRPQLTAVRGFLDLLSKSKIDVSQKELVDWSVSGVERMIRIITDMLNLSRITSGEFKVRLQQVSLLNMVQNELLAMEPLLRTSGVEVITEFVEDDAEVMGDDIKLREVMSNLLSNSVQYSPKKGKIKVKVYSEDNGWVFAVRDYGIGVDEKSRGKLFQKFFRTSAASDLRPSGTGVGLFLARKVIDEHNGKVFYKMPQEGQGSVFGFWLPTTESGKKS